MIDLSAIGATVRKTRRETGTDRGTILPIMVTTLKKLKYFTRARA